LISYQAERVQLRYKAYSDAVDILETVLNMNVPLLLKIASRMTLLSRKRARRVRIQSDQPSLFERMFDHTTKLRQLRMDILGLLGTIKQVVQNHHLIVGRNNLLCDEQKDRMQGWKQNLNLVTSGYQKVIG